MDSNDEQFLNILDISTTEDVSGSPQLIRFNEQQLKNIPSNVLHFEKSNALKSIETTLAKPSNILPEDSGSSILP